MTDFKALPDTVGNLADRIEISPEALAALGGTEWAYFRRMTGQEIRARFPTAPELAPDVAVFAVFRADGTPIALAETAQAALANMAALDLSPVTLH